MITKNFNNDDFEESDIYETTNTETIWDAISILDEAISRPPSTPAPHLPIPSSAHKPALSAGHLQEACPDHAGKIIITPSYPNTSKKAKKITSDTPKKKLKITHYTNTTPKWPKFTSSQ